MLTKKTFLLKTLLNLQMLEIFPSFLLKKHSTIRVSLHCCNVSNLRVCIDFSHVTQDMERVCITIEGGLILHGDVLVISFLAQVSAFSSRLNKQCLE